MTRTRASWIIGALAVVVVGAGGIALGYALNSDDDQTAIDVTDAGAAPSAEKVNDPPTPPPTEAATTSTTLDPESAWASVAAAYSSDAAVSPTFTIDGKLFRAAGDPAGPPQETSTVTIWEFDGQQWHESDSLEMEFPLAFSDVFTIWDATGDGNDDVLVSLAARNSFGAVISRSEGTWQTVQFGDHGKAVQGVVKVLPHPDGPIVQSQEQICHPSCAAGGRAELGWRYDTGTSQFEIDYTGGVPPGVQSECPDIVLRDEYQGIVDIRVEGTSCGMARYALVRDFQEANLEVGAYLHTVGWTCGGEQNDSDPLVYYEGSCRQGTATISWRY